jgi:hypothetical protein
MKLKLKFSFGLNTNGFGGLFAISCNGGCCDWWLLLKNFLVGFCRDESFG